MKTVYKYLATAESQFNAAFKNLENALIRAYIIKKSEKDIRWISGIIAMIRQVCQKRLIPNNIRSILTSIEKDRGRLGEGVIEDHGEAVIEGNDE